VTINNSLLHIHMWNVSSVSVKYTQNHSLVMKCSQNDLPKSVNCAFKAKTPSRNAFNSGPLLGLHTIH